MRRKADPTYRYGQTGDEGPEGKLDNSFTEPDFWTYLRHAILPELRTELETCMEGLRQLELVDDTEAARPALLSLWHYREAGKLIRFAAREVWHLGYLEWGFETHLSKMALRVARVRRRLEREQRRAKAASVDCSSDEKVS